MKILWASSEATPFQKVGGLGDVAGALPQAILKEGIEIRAVIPYHSSMTSEMKQRCHYIGEMYFYLGWRRVYCGVFTAQEGGVTYYLIDNEQYFMRRAPYGDYDDGERYAFFSKAVLEILPLISYEPDVIHVNDWHTALVPIYLDTQYRHMPRYRQIKTVFSIHNIEFQGKFSVEFWEDVCGIDRSLKSLAEYKGCINLMKGAIECANAVTTVSKTYAGEIQNPYFSFGLDEILRERSYKLSGIVNGIDLDRFNPETDPYIKTHYTYKTRMYKRFNKQDLQQRLCLPERMDVPVIGMVTRLTPQKGIDLLEQVAEEILKEDIQFVLLGTGYAEYENFLHYLEYAHRDKVRSIIDFVPQMAQKIYAGADLFLMPSKSEPCGLAQMIAMRYGTIPIVHAVGGLRDTVEPFLPAEGCGYGVTFQSYQAYDMLDAVHRGLAIWRDKAQRSSILHNMMIKDVSWQESAQEYIRIYERLCQ